MKKILLVEDEPAVADFVRKGLMEAGFEVSLSFSKANAVSMLADFTFDLLILDIMLPDGDGLSLCQEIRADGVQTPVLFLTALGTSENIAHGLNKGADDYLVKPFKFIELLARINAIFRRSQVQTEVHANVLRLADLEMNDDSKQVKRGQEEISLTATEYRLLMELMRNRGKVMNRMELLENVWGINYNLGTNVVDVYINYLRKKIDSQSKNKLIHTVVGMGYVLKEK